MEERLSAYLLQRLSKLISHGYTERRRKEKAAIIMPEEYQSMPCSGPNYNSFRTARFIRGNPMAGSRASSTSPLISVTEGAAKTFVFSSITSSPNR